MNEAEFWDGLVDIVAARIGCRYDENADDLKQFVRLGFDTMKTAVDVASCVNVTGAMPNDYRVVSRVGFE
jgi:hypothetical protein